MRESNRAEGGGVMRKPTHRRHLRATVPGIHAQQVASDGDRGAANALTASVVIARSERVQA